MSILTKLFKHSEQKEPDYFKLEPESAKHRRWRLLRQYTEWISVPLLAYTDYLPASWHIAARHALQTNDDELIHGLYNTMRLYSAGTMINPQRIDDLFGVKIREWKVQERLNDIEKDFV